MKGIAQTMDTSAISIGSDTHSSTNQHSISESIIKSLEAYFIKLEGQMPADLYKMVMTQVEKPLIQKILEFTHGNQSKAAKLLGISRGTLRKKMSAYQICF